MSQNTAGKPSSLYKTPVIIIYTKYKVQIGFLVKKIGIVMWIIEKMEVDLSLLCQ